MRAVLALVLLFAACAGVSHPGPQRIGDVNCDSDPDYPEWITVIGWTQDSDHPLKEREKADEHAKAYLKYCAYMHDPTAELVDVRVLKYIKENQSGFMFAEVTGRLAKRESRDR